LFKTKAVVVGFYSFAIGAIRRLAEDRQNKIKPATTLCHVSALPSKYGPYV